MFSVITDMVNDVKLLVDTAVLNDYDDASNYPLSEVSMLKEEALSQRLDLSYRSNSTARKAVADKYREESAKASQERPLIVDLEISADPREEIFGERLDLSYRSDPVLRLAAANRYRARVTEESLADQQHNDENLNERLDMSYRGNPSERKAVAERYRSQIEKLTPG